MRKSIYAIRLALIVLFPLYLLPTASYGQACTNTLQGGQAACDRSATTTTTEIVPSSGTVPVSSANYSPGTFFRLPVLAGGCYTVGTCGATFDTQINCYQGTATTGPFAYDDDAGPLCSTTEASVTLVPNFTDYARIDVRQYPCLPGGTSSITVTVQQNNNLAITSAGTSMCQGSVRTLTALPAPVTGAMPNSGSPGVFSGTGVSGATFTAPVPASSSQVYNINYAFGFLNTTQSITVFHAPTISNAGPDQTVCSSSATLGANAVTFGSGVWTIQTGTAVITSATSPTTSITGLVPGADVTLVWTISNGVCTASSDAVTIHRDPAPSTANAGPDLAVCQDTLQLSGNTPATGTGAWSVVTGTGSILTPSSPSSYIINLAVGVNKAVWSISNGVCPVSRDTVVITRDAQAPQPNAGADKAICDGQTALTGNIPPIGTGTWTLISGSGVLLSPNSPNCMLTAINVGTTVAQWSIVNGTCPVKRDTILITRNPLPNSPNVGGSQIVCYGNSATLTASSSAVSPTYLWWDSLSGGNLLAAGTVYTTPPLFADVTVYSEVNDGVTGCSSNRTQYTITVAPLPTVSLGPDQTFCDTDSACLDAGAGMASYQWSNGATSRVMCSSVGGLYWVEIMDPNGCHATDTIILNVNPSPVVNLGPNFTLCTGSLSNIGVTAVGGHSYLWDNGATTNSITVTNGGLYSLTVTDGNGCIGDDAIEVTQRDAPVAAFAIDKSGCPNVVFTDQSTDATTWSWSFGNGFTGTSQNPSTAYTSNGTYTVTLVATGDCGSDTIQQSVTIDCLVGMALPDNLAITVYPNPNEGIFKIHFEGMTDQCELSIFNALGQEVFSKVILGCDGNCDQLVDIKHVAKGTYFAKMKIGDLSISKQVLVR